MSLSKSIGTRDLELLVKTVASAVKIYNTAKPEETIVDTVHGGIPFSSIWDEDTKWSVIESAYASIIQAVGKIPKNSDVKIETAKIIATNAIMRNVTVEPTAASSESGLL